MAKPVLSGVLALFLSSAFAGRALAFTTWVVDDDRAQCPTARFTAIQPAIDAAASGDTIKVCPGRYTGSLAIDKALNIRGAQAGNDGRKRVVVDANESILTGAAGDHVVIFASGAILDGFLDRMPYDGSDAGTATDPTTSGWAIQNVVFDESGLAPNANGTTLSTLKKNLFKLHLGAGPAAVFSSDAHDIFIKDNGFQDGDMVFVSGSQLVVTDNHASGDGMFAFYGCQDLDIYENKFRNVTKFAALLLSGITTATVEANSARSVGSAYWVEGVNSDVTFTNNKVEGCGGIGISLSWDGVSVTGVTVLENEVDDCNTGIRLYGAAGDVIQSNSVEDNFHAGIDVQHFPIFVDDGGNTIIDNEVRGNGPPDCQDDSQGSGTSGTANFWIHDEGSTSSPAGLCVDHP